MDNPTTIIAIAGLVLALAMIPLLFIVYRQKRIGRDLFLTELLLAVVIACGLCAVLIENTWPQIANGLVIVQCIVVIPTAWLTFSALRRHLRKVGLAASDDGEHQAG